MAAGWQIQGRVVTGLGQGAGFTALPWARAAFIDGLGIDPWPGTLNVLASEPAALAAWSRVQRTKGVPIAPADAASCAGRCYPVRLGSRLPAAIVLPEVAGYRPDQIEIIAPVSLRDFLGLRDGDGVLIESAEPTALRAVIFDVDGTLVDSIDGYRIAAARAAEPRGYRVTRQAVQEALNRNLPFWEIVLAVEARSSPELVAALRAETMRHWPRVLEEHVRCFDGVRTTLEALLERGLRLGIYTGSTGESFRPLEQSGLFELFEVVITAADVTRRKPHPEGLFRCLEALAIEPADAAYVGDTMLDMQASRAAGMWAVGVLTGAGTSAHLAEAGADRLIAGHGRLQEALGLGAAPAPAPAPGQGRQ